MNGERMRLPKSVLLNTVNGEQPDNLPYVGATDPDMVCVPDAATIRVVPWASEAVALVIHDCQSYSIDAVNDFDPFFLELSAFCKAHALGVETLIHEAGAGQMEINFAH